MILVGFKTEAILLGAIFVERLVLVGSLAAGQPALTAHADERGCKMHRWARFSVRWMHSLLVFVSTPRRSRSRKAWAPSRKSSYVNGSGNKNHHLTL